LPSWRLDAHDAAQSRDAGRFPKPVAPFLAPTMRRANRKDLATLKAVLEANGPG
jgi:hypothetical protein